MLSVSKLRRQGLLALSLIELSYSCRMLFSINFIYVLCECFKYISLIFTTTRPDLNLSTKNASTNPLKRTISYSFLNQMKRRVLRKSNFTKKQFFLSLTTNWKIRNSPFVPPRSTGTDIHSIIMAPAPKGEHVPTLTSFSTAKGNIPNEIVLGTEKPHSPPLHLSALPRETFQTKLY